MRSTSGLRRQSFSSSECDPVATIRVARRSHRCKDKMAIKKEGIGEKVRVVKMNRLAASGFSIPMLPLE